MQANTLRSHKSSNAKLDYSSCLFFLLHCPCAFRKSSNQPGPQPFNQITTKGPFEFIILKIYFPYLIQLFILDAAMFQLPTAV